MCWYSSGLQDNARRGMEKILKKYIVTVNSEQGSKEYVLQLRVCSDFFTLHGANCEGKN